MNNSRVVGRNPAMGADSQDPGSNEAVIATADSQTSAASHFQSAASHLPQHSADARRPSLGEVPPLPPSKEGSRQDMRHSTPPRVDGHLPRQDSFVAPTVAPNMGSSAGVPTIPRSEDDTRRPSKSSQRQDPLHAVPTDADAGNLSAQHSSRRQASGRHVDSPSHGRPSSS